jgi:hypothetical protein
MDLLHRLVTTEPLLALFLTIALGYFVGKLKIGSFTLGGIAGTESSSASSGSTSTAASRACSSRSSSMPLASRAARNSSTRSTAAR